MDEICPGGCNDDGAHMLAYRRTLDEQLEAARQQEAESRRIVRITPGQQQWMNKTMDPHFTNFNRPSRVPTSGDDAWYEACERLFGARKKALPWWKRPLAWIRSRRWRSSRPESGTKSRPSSRSAPRSLP